jgi:hypothetical protein
MRMRLVGAVSADQMRPGRMKGAATAPAAVVRKERRDVLVGLIEMGL